MVEVAEPSQGGLAAHAHASADLKPRVAAGETRPEHQTRRKCQRWQRVTLRKIVAFARSPGIDLEDLEQQVARGREHAGTLGYAEAVTRVSTARASLLARVIRCL